MLELFRSGYRIHSCIVASQSARAYGAGACTIRSHGTWASGVSRSAGISEPTNCGANSARAGAAPDAAPDASGMGA